VGTDPFRTRDHVADFDDIVRDFVDRSKATRSHLEMVADISYGPKPSETLDLFFPRERRPGMPVHIFIHGGYWRMFSKRDYSYIADTVTEAGAIAVILDYALMPSVRMGDIIGQIRLAKRWVLGNIAVYDGDPQLLTVSGHSAGAHLASFLFHAGKYPSRVKASLLLGGLYDLKPLQSSFLQPMIGITDEEVASLSPLAHSHDPATRVSIGVGSQETQPFHEQAKAYSAWLQHQGLVVDQVEIAECNHMSSVRDLGVIGSATARYLMQLISDHSSK
jgi:arylformamidase